MAVLKDPMILLSYLNTRLRDGCPSLEELCRVLDLEQKEVEEKLAAVGYRYDKKQNRFV